MATRSPLYGAQLIYEGDGSDLPVSFLMPPEMANAPHHMFYVHANDTADAGWGGSINIRGHCVNDNRAIPCQLMADFRTGNDRMQASLENIALATVDSNPMAFFYSGFLSLVQVMVHTTITGISGDEKLYIWMASGREILGTSAILQYEQS